MADDVDYGLVEPFGIDDGSLDGLSPQECFTLGVEWEMFRQRLKAEETAFQEQVHSANAGRMQAMCQRHGRTCTRHWLHEDYAEWCVLHVGATLREEGALDG